MNPRRAPHQRKLQSSGGAAVAVFLLLLLAGIPSCTEDESSPVVPDPNEPPPDYERIEEYSEDARVLAAREARGPWIDVELTAEIDEVLRKTRPLRPEFASIHAFKDFDLHELIAKAGPDLAPLWHQGLISVGDPYLDSLSTVFSLARVDSLLYVDDVFILTFGVSLNMRAVGELYDHSRLIHYAEPNGFSGDGDWIWAFEKNETWHVVYSQGRGDCPSGCTWRSLFYVELPPSGAGTIVEEFIPGGPWPSWPYPRWNIPERYSVTSFQNVDNLLAAFEHSDWWMRRHAIEATWRLVVRDSPMYGEDIGETWGAMRTEILRRRAEVIARLRERLRDSDEDVRESAARALQEMGV